MTPLFSRALRGRSSRALLGALALAACGDGGGDAPAAGGGSGALATAAGREACALELVGGESESRSARLAIERLAPRETDRTAMVAAPDFRIDRDTAVEAVAALSATCGATRVAAIGVGPLGPTRTRR